MMMLFFTHTWEFTGSEYPGETGECDSRHHYRCSVCGATKIMEFATRSTSTAAGEFGKARIAISDHCHQLEQLWDDLMENE